MAEISLKRVKMYDPSTYKSLEQRILEPLSKSIGKGLVDFTSSLIKFSYATIVSPLRIPTFFRRYLNNQSLLDRTEFEKLGTMEKTGCVFGLGVGAITDITLMPYIMEETSKGNYIPLLVLGVPNVVSGLFEIGRWKTSRKEYLGFSKFKAKERERE